ncbi:MAG TPA: hypothetical protein VH370_20545 [Humisphaera sp.]|jgi:tRNA C32,U32 (ribose-2'-O)-methylase TrmJ|nr:hypothetical protein [Humisphaera sp.]
MSRKPTTHDQRVREICDSFRDLMVRAVTAEREVRRLKRQLRQRQRATPVKK